MFSIIITTYDRSDILKLTLEGYLKQSAPYLIRELIVIDDGSDERHRALNETMVEEAAHRSSFMLKYLYQDNKGPAAARNKGIAGAEGDIVLITGDDIVPHVDMVKEHFFFHRKRDMDPNIGVLGRIAWPRMIKVTPFMEYINEMGLQFGYSIIPDPEDVPFNFFYSSNVSLHRDFLLKGDLFEVDFPYAAWEDIELAYRLKKRGLRIVYNPDAIGYHHHPITFSSFRERQEKCGYSACIFYKKHPELKNFLGINSLHRGSLVDLWIKGKEQLCLLLEGHGIKKSLPEYYRQVMSFYYEKGIKKYMKNNLKA